MNHFGQLRVPVHAKISLAAAFPLVYLDEYHGLPRGLDRLVGRWALPNDNDAKLFDPVRVHVDAAEHHLALTLQPGHGFGGGDEAAIIVLQRDGDLLVLLETAGPPGRRVLDAEFLVAADEVAVVVPHQTSVEQVGFGEHLEAVADAEY